MPQSDKAQITVNVETRTAAEYRAADLPEGSVVATDYRAWVKQPHKEFPTLVWLPGNWLDEQMQTRLDNGAQVLRVGTGQEG